MKRMLLWIGAVWFGASILFAIGWKLWLADLVEPKPPNLKKKDEDEEQD